MTFFIHSTSQKLKEENLNIVNLSSSDSFRKNKDKIEMTTSLSQERFSLEMKTEDNMFCGPVCWCDWSSDFSFQPFCHQWPFILPVSVNRNVINVQSINSVRWLDKM